ncbi:hypothetical protein GDO86_001637, partial [Hymenochirus boettgeri]
TLTFGVGTRLSVEPGEHSSSKPTVFVLKPQKTDSPAACLVKDFYPKDVEIYMNSTQRNSGIITASPVLSQNGKYSAVHVDRLGTEDLHCQAKHQGEWVRDSYKRSEKREILPETKDEDLDKENPCDQPDSYALSFEKVNIISMTVLGMRLLCAKMLAFNLLLSVKCFIL